VNARVETQLALAVIARCAHATGHDAPAAALHGARRCVVDWLGVALAGMAEPAPQWVAQALGAQAGQPLGDGTCPAANDALVMGTAGHVLDFDDTDYVNLVHVSASVVPALVAIARRHPVTGPTLLNALVAGYEVEATLGRRLGRPLTARGWHVSGVLGHAGAAAAAAIALGLDAAKIAQAMAIALTGSSGLIAAFGTLAKSLQLGRTAAGGVLAAQLAAQEFTGPVGLLDTGTGFAETVTGARAVDWQAIAGQWGAPYAILQNAFKPHASCMITHASVDAAIALHAALREQGAATRDIERVTCRVNVLAPQVAGHAMPASGLLGKFSTAYCVAAGLCDGRATPDVFTDAAVRRTDALHLLQCTDVVVDAGVGEQQAEVELRLRDGRVLRERTAMAKGNPANPMTDADLSRKFLALAVGRLHGNADALLETLWRLDRISDAGRALAPYLD
jgi:2-methylcitrate dehydratase PrpD